VEDLHIWDFGNIENAITGNGAPPNRARVSFTVKWTASGASTHFDNPSQKYRGDFFTGATAQIEYEVHTGDFDIVSAPLGASTTLLAQLGKESDGAFY
jgi:hypothetical protein